MGWLMDGTLNRVLLVSIDIVKRSKTELGIMSGIIAPSTFYSVVIDNKCGAFST